MVIGYATMTPVDIKLQSCHRWLLLLQSQLAPHVTYYRSDKAHSFPHLNDNSMCQPPYEDFISSNSALYLTFRPLTASNILQTASQYK